MSIDGQRFHSVWDAIEDSPELAKEMERRSDMMIALTEHIRQQEWSTAEAARRADVPEARIADLLSGNIEAFSQEKLQAMFDSVGLRRE